MDTLGNENLPEFVTAYTQNALDPTEAEQVRAWLRDHPESAAEIDRGTRLTTEVRRGLLATSPPVPASLRDRINALRSEAQPSTLRPNFDRFRPARMLALAASILIALGIGLVIGRSTGGPNLKPPVSDRSDVIPVSTVARVDRIHAMCARVAEELHKNGYPTDAGALPDEVAADMHGDKPYPDLSSIGFKYIGAGPCGDALPGTVHLLYKSVRPGSVMAVSLFVQENHGQFPIDPGRLYRASDDREAFPLYVWRTDKVVYFLVADSDAIAKKAMAVIAGAPH